MVIIYVLIYTFTCRIGPMEVDPNIVAQLQSQLVRDLENSDDSASDEEEDAFNWEWEAVSFFLTCYRIM